MLFSEKWRFLFDLVHGNYQKRRNSGSDLCM